VSFVLSFVRSFVLSFVLGRFETCMPSSRDKASRVRAALAGLAAADPTDGGRGTRDGGRGTGDGTAVTSIGRRRYRYRYRYRAASGGEPTNERGVARVEWGSWRESQGIGCTTRKRGETRSGEISFDKAPIALPFPADNNNYHKHIHTYAQSSTYVRRPYQQQ
jgi:hypothetical protein